MKSATTFKISVLFTLGAIGLLFQNFDFNSSATFHLQQVDQKNRVQHAKELLGSNYRGSVAQKAEHIADLHVTIYDNVVHSLPKKYRVQSLALAETIIAEAQANDLDPVFVMAMIKTESEFNPKARGTHGEIGLMQLKPDTAQWIAKAEGIAWHGPATLENPVENVRLGVAYISQLREKTSGFANKYVSAYNLGYAKMSKMYKTSLRPHEYSLRVMKNYKDFYTHMVASRMTTVAGN